MKKTLYVGAFVVISMSGSIYASQKTSKEAPAKKGTYVSALASAHAKLHAQGLRPTLLLNRFEQRPTDQFGYPVPSSVGKTIERHWTQDIGGSKEALRAAMGSTTKIVVAPKEEKPFVQQTIIVCDTKPEPTAEKLTPPARSPHSVAKARMPKKPDYESTTVVHSVADPKKMVVTKATLVIGDTTIVHPVSKNATTVVNLAHSERALDPDILEADVDINDTIVIHPEALEPEKIAASSPEPIVHPTGISRDVRGTPKDCLTQIEHIYNIIKH